MIKPITEEYFRKVVGPCEKCRFVQIKIPKELSYRVWSGKPAPEKQRMPWDNTDGYLYFEKPGEGVFALIAVDNPGSMLIVPSQYPNLIIDENETIDFSDWRSTYLGPPNPIYTLNALQRTETWSGCCEGLVGEINNGDYLVENKEIGFSQVITVKVSKYPWSTHLYVGFPELLELPYNKTLVDRISNKLKNYILWSQKD